VEDARQNKIRTFEKVCHHISFDGLALLVGMDKPTGVNGLIQMIKFRNRALSNGSTREYPGHGRKSVIEGMP
jgi:hypothetical protein